MVYGMMLIFIQICLRIKYFFIFDSDDLKHAYSLDSEQNAYIQLIEDLNIYNSKEENKEILKKWLKEYGNYLENDKNN
jgi:hypothetical protein